MLSVFAVDYLRPSDFDKESWSKVVDYLEYVDVYAASHGKPRPPAGARANLFMTYVNYSGVQMLYAGLSNITMGLGAFSLTLPIQTFMIHYKTENRGRDIVTASLYIMLLAYNETEATIFPDSPDKKDILYASFSIGFDLSSLISTDKPALNTRTAIIPLTHTEKNRWRWGMTYNNLTAIWWRVNIAPDNSSYQSIPAAVSVYEELTFTYDLSFDLDDNTAKIKSNYKIGRMTDLWVLETGRSLPIIVHYNSSGCYRLKESKYSDETIHQFLNGNDIGISMVLFQASAILDHVTESKVEGQNVMDNELIVSNEKITTFAEDGEKVSEVNFGSNNSYTLHDYTSGTSTTHKAVTRTAEKKGFAKNPIFKIHTFLMSYIPMAIAHMDEPLYEQAKNKLLDMTYADYFYIISYPTYNGYTIEHDPTYTFYVTPTTAGESNFGGLIAITAITGIIIAATVIILRRKNQRNRPNRYQK